MNKVTKSAFLGLALACGYAFAQETVTTDLNTQESGSNDWNLKVGISTRNFKSPRFSAASSAAQELAYALGDTEYRPLNEVLDSIRNDPFHDVYVGTLGASSAGGRGSYGLEDKLGFLVGGSYTLSEQDSFRLSLVADFQYFQSNSGRYAGYSGNTSVVRTTASFGTLSPIWREEAEPYENGLLMSNGVAKLTMDMDLYVLDLGASVAYEAENGFILSLAAGPTLSLADIDSSCRYLGSSFQSSTKRTDNDNEFEYGYFISGGVSYWFNERYGISGEMRYDNAFGDVGTRYVKQNLDTWGGNIAFLMRF